MSAGVCLLTTVCLRHVSAHTQASQTTARLTLPSEERHALLLYHLAATYGRLADTLVCLLVA